MRAFSHNLISLTLLGSLLLGGPVRAAEMVSVEVFKASGKLLAQASQGRLRAAKITTYMLDGLDRFESSLSEGLPADVDVAKTEALRRIQQLDEARMARAKNTAFGLAKAVQYGIDRYPAIVFDGEAVVYGVTDLAEAVDHYEAWRRERVR